LPEEALARVLRGLGPLPAHEVPLCDALDGVLAEEVVAGVPLPGFDNAAMDGYAVRAADADGGRRLRVVGDVRAGEVAFVHVGRGEACRVMTGAPVPEGADTVVPFEVTRTPESGDACARALTELPPAWVEVTGPVTRGRHVRRTGEDVPTGQVLALPGTVVRPSEIALFSAVGRHTVRVTRPPVVAVLSTGDELARPGEPLEPGTVHDVNGPALAALVRRAGGIPVLGGLVRDRSLALVDRLEALAGSVDLVVTSGGASGGVADVVAGLAGSRHAVDTLSVRMRPGKPLVLGRIRVPGGSGGSVERSVPLVGLPGNPVAAMVAFEVFVAPAIARLRGLQHDGVHVVEALAADELRSTPGRVCFARVRVTRDGGGQLVAASTGGGCGHGTGSLLGTNGLAMVPDDGVAVLPGDLVRVRMTGWSA
jgi:molybdenum cofactor synthesis domain-containing protein